MNCVLIAYLLLIYYKGGISNRCMYLVGKPRTMDTLSFYGVFTQSLVFEIRNAIFDNILKRESFS